MKRSVLFLIIAVLLIIFTVSCSKNEVGQVRNPDKPVIMDITDEISRGDDEYIDFLAEMEGFWARPEGYTVDPEDKLSGITEILVEWMEGCWTPYFNGIAGQTLKCTADINGLLLYDVEGEELVVLAYDGESLLNDDGSVAFERIMTVEERLEAEKE